MLSQDASSTSFNEQNGDTTQNSTPPLAICVSDLSFAYNKTKPVLEIQRWEVEQGKHVFLYGPSGSGKSTLLNLLGGVLKPSHGHISLLGTSMLELSSRAKDKFRAQHVGIIFQQFNLVPYLSVVENIELAAHFSNKKKIDVYAHAEGLFDSLALPKSLFKQRTAELSVGQQQRVAIARALINTPELLIADEPSSALDSDARDSFMDLLLTTAENHRSTLVFVSHDRSLAGHFSTVTELSTINHVNIDANRGE